MADDSEIGGKPTDSDQAMAVVYSSATVDAEIEASVIRGVLESNGIPSVLSSTPYHSLTFEVRVPGGFAEEAQRRIAEAKAAGADAAAAAEAASEEGVDPGTARP
jgi:hypothetical protein